MDVRAQDMKQLQVAGCQLSSLIESLVEKPPLRHDRCLREEFAARAKSVFCEAQELSPENLEATLYSGKAVQNYAYLAFRLGYIEKHDYDAVHSLCQTVHQSCEAMLASRSVTPVSGLRLL